MARKDSPSTGVGNFAIRHRLGGRSGATSVAAFSAQLLAFSHHVKERVADVTQQAALFAWESLTTLTPVRSGRARFSWNLSENRPSYFVPPVGTYSYPATPVMGDPQGEFHPVFVTSGLPYMQMLEDGYSEKGSKMTEKTLHALDISFPSIIGGRNNV